MSVDIEKLRDDMRALGMRSLGQDIRKRRLELGLGLRETARHIGVSAPYLLNIEQGKERPTDERIKQLAEALGLRADDLRALTGRIPEDVLRMLRHRPDRWARLREMWP